MATDTARTISLTLTQRMGLDDLVAGQKGKRRDAFMVFHRVHRKLKLSFEYRNELSKRRVIVQTGQGFAIDEEAAEKEPVFELALETAEVYQLRTLLNDLDLPSVAAMDWIEPILDQLEAKIPEGS